jgi:hypothetical protein
MPLINFELKPPASIAPFGVAPNTSLHWFGLTDGDLCLTLGPATLYEYTEEIMHQWEGRPTRNSDYYLARFLEDFTELFSAIAESVPASLYSVVKEYASLQSLQEGIDRWQDAWFESSDPVAEAAHDAQYDLLTAWIYARSLFAGHLKGGPRLSVFRHDETIAFVWKADHRSEDQLPYWTAGNGAIEMPYATFVEQVEDFGHRFFPAMARQVEIAVRMAWSEVRLDIQRLVKEQEERKAAFDEQLAILKRISNGDTDWPAIERLTREIDV